MRNLLLVAWLTVSPILAHGESTFSYDRHGPRCVADSAAEVVRCIAYCRDGTLAPDANVVRGEAERECRDFLMDDWRPWPYPWLGDVPA